VLFAIGSAARPTPSIGTLSHRSLACFRMDDLPLAASGIAQAISPALNHTQVNFGWQARLPETREPIGSAIST
jgi:hypothetical protein